MAEGKSTAAHLAAYCKKRLPILIVLMGILALSTALAGMHWTLELACHFQFFYALAALAMLVLAIGFRLWRWAALSAVLMLFFALKPLVLMLGSRGDAAAERAESHTLLIFNLLLTNTNHDGVRAALAAERADIVLLLEVTPEWESALSAWAEENYPHRLKEIHDSPFGIWLLSKAPLENATIEHIGGSGFPVVTADVLLGEKKIRLLGAHPTPPGRERTELQYQQFRSYPRLLETSGDLPPDGKILCGDLNTTPFSPGYRNLLEQTKLRDSAQGFRWRHTWSPVKNFFLGLPLDHIFVSESITVQNREVGPSLGSDHRWVKIHFTIR
jgi:endonuclease/exonuclease/phosphatase (EEP) superfamily protein YafD